MQDEKSSERIIPRKICRNHDHYIADQLGEMHSEHNLHMTRCSLRDKGIERDPTLTECLLHYIENGGAEDFRRRHVVQQSENLPDIVIKAFRYAA